MNRTTMAHVRRDVARARRSMRKASHAAWYAAKRMDEAVAIVKAATNAGIDDEARAYLEKVLTDLQKRAWENYSATPDHQLARVCTLINAEDE